MIRSTKAIVRSVIPGCSIKPGAVVWVSNLAFESGSGRRFPATAETSPDPIFWIDPEYLLSMDHFLKKRQPIRDYWAVMFGPSFLSGDPKFAIEQPMSETLGLKPYRFESLGEVVYYFRLHALDPTKFNIAHTCMYKVSDFICES
jgi:hypothetical protein